MRKKRAFPYMAVILICLFTACSSEDPEKLPLKIPEITGQEIEQNHIQLVFCPLEETQVLTLNITTNNEQEKPVLINWGDGNKPQYYPQGIIQHEYSSASGAYTVTLYAPGIKVFKIEQEGANRVRSLFFGECPELSQISYPNAPNIMKDLDLRACPQFNHTALVHIYDPDFNLRGLWNFDNLHLYFYHSEPLLIEDLPAGMIELHVAHRVSAITVRNIPNATAINIKGLKALSRVETVNLEAPRVTDLRIDNIDFRTDLPDLAGLPSLRLLCYTCVDADHTLPISPTLEVFEIDNTFTTDPYRISHLDFTSCKNLKHLVVRGVKNLSSLNREGLENLEFIWIYRSGKVDDLYYKKEERTVSTSGRAVMEDNEVLYNPNMVQFTSVP